MVKIGAELPKLFQK